VRFVTAQETAHRVLYHEDIDLTKMNNLAKVKKSSIKQILILCRATKAQGKVTGIFHYTPTSTTRNYYDEEIIDRDGPFIIYQLDSSKYFQNAVGFQLVSIL
jgi:hypothetical protein